MILFDVNVLLNAHREEQTHHEVARTLLAGVVGDPAPFGVSELVLSAFLRVATHRRALDPPTSLGVALAFCDDLRRRPNARVIAPGPRHWAIFERLCRRGAATGTLIADAYLAALAIESGCTWVSFDRDFARFRDLEWHDPLDDQAGEQ